MYHKPLETPENLYIFDQDQYYAVQSKKNLFVKYHCHLPHIGLKSRMNVDDLQRLLDTLLSYFPCVSNEQVLLQK
jgi:hypothetical protein